MMFRLFRVIDSIENHQNRAQDSPGATEQDIELVSGAQEA